MFGIRAGADSHVSLGFSVVGVFKQVFGMGFFSRRIASAVSFCFSICLRLTEWPVCGMRLLRLPGGIVV